MAQDKITAAVKKLPPLNVKTVQDFRPVHDETKPFPFQNECANCNGTGWVRHLFTPADQNRSDVPDFEPCPVCKPSVSTLISRYIKKGFEGLNSSTGGSFTTVNIKPLSVNECWQGRRFKTPAYKAYCDAVSLLLPKEIFIPAGLLYAHYEFGLSSMAGDFDNPIKPAQDIIAKKYKFNDKRIRKATITLVQVPKGQEYLKFRFESL